MRRFVLLLGILLALSTGQRALAQPRLFIPEGTNLDFGLVPTGKNHLHTLSIHNIGTQPLKISNVSASCGCTGTLMSHNTVAPGDSTILTITFDPSRFAGVVDKSITMNTNDTAHASVRILFKANVVKALLVEPSYVVFRTTPTLSVVDTVVVENAGAETVHILSAKSSSDAVAVATGSTSLKPGESTDIILRFTPSGAGTSKGTVTILTDHPSMPSIDVRFFSLVTANADN